MSSTYTTSAQLLPFDSATTELYTLSLHDALPISPAPAPPPSGPAAPPRGARPRPPPGWPAGTPGTPARSEEHTSELQSLAYLVCRLLLEKKKRWSRAWAYRWPFRNLSVWMWSSRL